jgi:hypothetical protein
MYTGARINDLKRYVELGTTSTTFRSSLTKRLPRRTIRQVFSVPLTGDDQWTIPAAAPSNRHRHISYEGQHVDVAAIPSSDGNCRHNLIIEDGTYFKKYDLPSTTCVTVTQRFDAGYRDVLQFDCVILLSATRGFAADRPAVRAFLVNRGTEWAASLVDRSIEYSSRGVKRRTTSRFRETKSFAVPIAGQYELRFITFVDRIHPGSEAHLLVTSARVTNRFGRETNRLASLSCIGRVRAAAMEDA